MSHAGSHQPTRATAAAFGSYLRISLLLLLLRLPPGLLAAALSRDAFALVTGTRLQGARCENKAGFSCHNSSTREALHGTRVHGTVRYMLGASSKQDGNRSHAFRPDDP